MIDIREYSKALVRYAPTHLLETITNYSVLREERLIPLKMFHRVGKKVLYQAALDHIGDNPILLLEFGVFEGSSISKWCELDRHPDTRIVGFDSFTGLPQRWRSRAPGYFGVNGQVPLIEDSRVCFVKGWFNETLVPWWQSYEPKSDAVPLVHIDSDLYSSALYLLTRLNDFWPRYFVVFDDYPSGEARALRDYLNSWGASFEPLIGRKRQPYSRLPGQVFGLITTVQGGQATSRGQSG